jgi:two-component system, sensor histidine kinase YesM
LHSGEHLVNPAFHLVSNFIQLNELHYFCSMSFMIRFLSSAVLVLILGMIPNFGSLAHAQDSTHVQRQSLSSMADEIEKLLKEGAPSSVLAKKYEALAREFKIQNQPDKAIFYYNKAAEHYQLAKMKDDASRMFREVAKLNELQMDMPAAAQNYNSAAKLSKPAINSNDAARVAAPSVAEKIQANDDNYRLIQSDSKLFEAEEVAVMLYNQGNLKEEAGFAAEAQSLKIDAFQLVSTANIEASRPELVALQSKIGADLADDFVKQNRMEDAIKTMMVSRDLAFQTGDVQLAVQNSIKLADLYLQSNQFEQGLLILKDAYRLALSFGRTLDARAALLALNAYFHKNKDTESQLFFYEDFVKQLDELIRRDSSMIDQKIFQAKEERIEQLEKERTLQNQLLIQTRNWNYGIVTFFVVLLLASSFLFWSFMKVRMQNKKIALQSLRREMNPHFIFNSLNSVNRFIAQNDEIKANQYLTSYAQLMRTTMEVSSKDFISLDKEIELLRKYLELEHLRFGQHFDFEIQVDENIQREDFEIPGFLIQPHLENAIWHGLRYRKSKGKLTLSMQREGKQLRVSIEDNGIGIEESKKLKTENQKSHKSRGFSNMEERIGLLNGLYGFKIVLDVQSPINAEGGTVVAYLLPLREIN